MGWEGDGRTHVMHGRSRMIMNPRIPTMPGRSSSGFHRPGVKHCLHQACDELNTIKLLYFPHLSTRGEVLEQSLG